MALFLNTGIDDDDIYRAEIPINLFYKSLNSIIQYRVISHSSVKGVLDTKMKKKGGGGKSSCKWTMDLGEAF